MATVNNSLQKRETKVGLTAYLTQDAVKDQINKVLGGKDGQKFITSIISAVQINPKLQECTNSSLLTAALLGASLNLSPSPQLGQYYPVPYKNNKTGVTEAQFQIGWKGMYQLAIRSGQYKKLNVLAIKEGELIRYDPIEEEIEVNLIQDDEARENAPTIGYYAFFVLKDPNGEDGLRKAMYWSKAKMMAHAKRYSQGYRNDLAKGTSYTFWSTDFDGMAYKTMLRQLIGKYGAMSIEMQTAYESDQAVIHEDGSKSYVDTVYEAPATPKAIESDPNATVQRAEEIINRAEAKIEAEKKATKKKTIKTESEEPANDAAAALFGEEDAE